jgi:inosine-uridine nucleoside N-ribohydrolase
MPTKLIILSDMGIDGAFATALALHDPRLEVLGLAASAGNVSANQATRNVQVLVEQLDPPRWPRIGAARPVAYDCDATNLHGPDGLGGINFPCAQLHHQHPADKLLVDVLRQDPGEVTVMVLGPATTLAAALEREPDVAGLLGRVVMVGGAWRESGDASAVAEFHFYCDPRGARQVLRSGVPITLLPLDVTRRLLFSPSDLLRLPAPESRTCRFLSQIAPHAIAPSASLYGVEGFFLQDVLGIIAASLPGILTTRPMSVDVETTGELTRGMSVVDNRWSRPTRPNVDLATEVDITAVREYIRGILEGCAP